MNKTVSDEELLKITEKYNKGSYMAVLQIKSASRELLACEPLIPKRASRSKKNPLEYNLNKYEKNVTRIKKEYEELKPYLRGDFELRIPQHPMETLRELDVILSDAGYTKKDIKTILNMINFYDVNITWGKEQREKRERAKMIAELFEQPVFPIFKTHLK